MTAFTWAATALGLAGAFAWGGRTARVKANKGVFSHYKRVHVTAVEQAN